MIIQKVNRLEKNNYGEISKHITVHILAKNPLNIDKIFQFNGGIQNEHSVFVWNLHSLYSRSIPR